MGFVPLPYRALAADQQGVEGLEGLVADCSAGEDVRLNIPPQTGQQNGENRSRDTAETSPGVRLQVQAVE